MRRSGRILPLAIAASLAAPAVAGVPGMAGGGDPSPVRTQPLAPGEVLLEVGGVGLIVSRADLATITVPVFSGGTTPAAARRANLAEVRRLVAAVRRAGVPADGIETREGDWSGSFVMTVDSAAGMDSPEPAHHAVSTVTIRLRDVELAPAVRAALETAGADNVALPVYSLTDRTAARREAQRLALASARADAEAYAGQVRMRLARMVRVSERVGADLYGIAINNEALFRSLQTMGNPSQPQTGPEIVTLVMVGVDYALAPQ